VEELPEHVARNRVHWDDRAGEYVEEGRRKWKRAEPDWGIFGVPEAEVGMLPILCVPDDGNIPTGDELLRPLFGMHRIEWPDDDAVEFHLPQGKMVELLRDCGLEVEELIEIRPPADATTRFTHISLDWARRYPPEEVWRVRKPT
jgi:hypothetical protein